MIVGALIGAGISVVGSIIGGNKAASAAKSQANEQNAATQRRYEYDMQKWELDKEAIMANRDFAIQEIAAKERNEGRVADFTDAMNTQRYQRDLQIRNLEQKSNEDQYRRSEEVYTKQLGLNAASYQTGYESERRKLEEVHTEQAFDKQEAYLGALIREGQLRARGMNGRSAAKGGQVNAADFGRQIAQLNEGFDFGPQPVLGAISSPSAAAGRVWGSTISGIAGTVGNFVGSTSANQLGRW